MQPQEFYDLLEGYVWRKERREDMLAYFTCRLMNLQLVNPISPAELLKPLRGKKEAEKRQQDEEYIKETFKALLNGGDND